MEVFPFLHTDILISVFDCVLFVLFAVILKYPPILFFFYLVLYLPSLKCFLVMGIQWVRSFVKIYIKNLHSLFYKRIDAEIRMRSNHISRVSLDN